MPSTQPGPSEPTAGRTHAVAGPPAAEILAERSRVVLDDNAAQRFLDALDHPERFADRLRWLADRPSVLSDE